MYKRGITAASVLQDLSRRKIDNDFEHAVNQGTLKLWRLSNELLAELHLGGGLFIRGKCAYTNTLSPQAIADDVMEESKLTKIDAELWGASSMGKLGGSAKSDAKIKAAKENGKKGGRPKKPKKPINDSI